MSHTASSGGLASNGLLAPVDYDTKNIRFHPVIRVLGLTLAHLGSRESAGSAGLLLLVERTVTTALADAVTLGVLLTKASGSFGLLG